MKLSCFHIAGKNNRLWEVINTLEKRNEELSAENSSLKQELLELEDKLLEKGEKQQQQQVTNVVVDCEQKQPVLETYHILGSDDGQHNGEFSTSEQINNLLKELEQAKALVTELKVQVNIEKWQKEELDSQLQDEIHGNQILHQKIAELNKEVLEWESFAQKEECYRRIAEAFTRKHNIEVEETIVHNLNHQHNSHPFIHPLSPGSLSKAKSCEFLSYAPKSENNKQNIIKSCTIRNTLLTTGNSSSILSELDKEYDDLVKRYEALLEKCKQEGRFTENPERTRKVQRAIQTLSLDFSKLTTPIQSPTKTSKSPSATCDKCFTVSHTKSVPNINDDTACDYKALFSQIFEKLKESKEASQ